MKYLQLVFVWFKLGWPFAKAAIEVIKDGKITREELYAAIDLAVDEDGITLWEK